MPELSCTVQTCVHNYQYLCELDKIQVGGNSAKDAKETCCDCRYNEECKCHAGKISVEGGDACHSSGTECATFDCCCN